MTEILIVDDEGPMRELISRWLAAEGFTTVEAPDAESALRVLAERPIAVATIDKDMPGHNGLWLVEQIQHAHPTVAMLLATGDSQISPLVSLSKGIQGYLVKPLRRDRVLSAVKDALAWREWSASQPPRPNRGADLDTEAIDSWLQGRAGRPPKEGA